MKNKTILNKLAIILLFISILFSIRCIWLSIFKVSNPVPVINNGVLDLRSRIWSSLTYSGWMVNGASILRNS